MTGFSLPRSENLHRSPKVLALTALFDVAIERVNITLPRRVVRRLDDLAAARHQSRGAFIAELTMHVKNG